MGKREEGFVDGLNYSTAKVTTEEMIEFICETKPDPYDLAGLLKEAEANYKQAREILEKYHNTQTLKYPIDQVVRSEITLLDMLRNNLDILSKGARIIEQLTRLCGCEKDYWKRKSELEEAQVGGP